MSQGIIDEYTLCEKLGYDAAQSVLQSHWDSWATLSDFQKIANSGFNLVRIPIGFWAYDNANTPYVTGAADQLDNAVSELLFCEKTINANYSRADRLGQTDWVESCG